MTLAAQRDRKKKAVHRAADAATLLRWYDRHRRRLPWRAAPGETADPYRVWLSEIMLQQTTVKAVAPYYERFLTRWPRIQDLGGATLVEVLKLWAGLGYYARARNLHACARTILEQHGGEFPDTEEKLRELPGIGAYTAAAIAAIAFARKATPVDGNIERVIARLFAMEEPLPAVKSAIRAKAEALTPDKRAGDFAQATMDLGATICTPKRPACSLCPWNEPCVARARGDQETFPRKMPKAEGKLRRGAAFVALRADGAILVRTRPEKGLLGGMTEVPTTEWTHQFDEREALIEAPFSTNGKKSPLPNPPPQERGREKKESGGREKKESGRKEKENGAGKKSVIWRKLPGVVTHTFTHFPLELTVYAAGLPRSTRAPKGARWIKAQDIAGEAFPNVMRKVIAHALDLAAR